MAKEKISNQIDKNKQEDETKQTAVPKTDLAYTGEVTLSISNGKKIISSRTYHNEGKQPLFNFLYACLQGDFLTASKMRPNKIMLFNTIEKPVEFLADEKDSLLTSFIASNSAVVKDNNEGIVFHFFIPFSNFKIIGSDNKIIITEVALYNQDKNDKEYSKPSAVYLLTKDGKWDPVVFENNKKFNLIIEWKLKIANYTEQER